MFFYQEFLLTMTLPTTKTISFLVSGIGAMKADRLEKIDKIKIIIMIEL